MTYQQLGKILKSVGFAIFVFVAIGFLVRSNTLSGDNVDLSNGKNKVEQVVSKSAPVIQGVNDLCQRKDRVSMALANADLCQTAKEVKNVVPQVIIPVKPMPGQNALCFDFPNLPQCKPIPGKDGKPGKNAFCYDNPSNVACLPKQGPKGDSGSDGKDGRNAYCYDNPDDPNCQPQMGTPGADGVSVVDTQPVRNSDNVCEWRVIYSNGKEKRYPAGDAACPPASTPTNNPSSPPATG